MALVRVASDGWTDGRTAGRFQDLELRIVTLVEIAQEKGPLARLFSLNWPPPSLICSTGKMRESFAARIYEKGLKKYTCPNFLDFPDFIVQSRYNVIDKNYLRLHY